MEKRIRVLTGTNGKVWVNGMLLATATKLELKVTGNFEEKNFCGDFGTHNYYTGWNGEGSITIGKTDSTVLAMLAEGYKTGNMPDIKIITALTDAATGKAERVAVSDVVFTEFMLASFESKGLIEEQIPLKFSEYEVLEQIA